MTGWQATPCSNLHGMSKCFDVVFQRLVLPLLFSFLVFSEPFLVIFMAEF
jgi:hypothetical protein